MECQTRTWEKKTEKGKKSTASVVKMMELKDVTFKMLFGILRIRRYFIDALREILWWFR